MKLTLLNEILLGSCFLLIYLIIVRWISTRVHMGNNKQNMDRR